MVGIIVGNQSTNSGWNPPPLVIRAFGAHCQLRTWRESVRPDALTVAPYKSARAQTETVLCPREPARRILCDRLNAAAAVLTARRDHLFGRAIDRTPHRDPRGVID